MKLIPPPPKKKIMSLTDCTRLIQQFVLTL
jgi:hypothetical protein